MGFLKRDANPPRPATAPGGMDRRGKDTAAIKGIASLALVAGTLAAAFLWCAEPWQRPDVFSAIPEPVFLALACLGLGGLALMAARGRRIRWQPALAIGVSGLLLLAGLRGLSGAMTRGDLLRRIQQENRHHHGNPSVADDSKPLSAKLVAALED